MKLKKFTYDPSMATLSSLLAEFHDSSNKEGAGKGIVHSYIEIYEKVFPPRRETARYVMKIGIYSGAFLKVLADYFKNAEIYGIDI